MLLMLLQNLCDYKLLKISVKNLGHSCCLMAIEPTVSG